MRQVALVCALACVTAGEPFARADGADPASAEARARERYRRGLSLFNAGLFDAAAVEFEAGYELKPLPLFLYNAAQAQRRGNHPQRALELYRRYVLADPLAPEAEEATHHIRELEEQLRNVTPVVAPVNKQVVVAAPPPARPWFRDPLGGTLAATGGAALVSGLVLLGIGGAWSTAPIETHDDFERAKHGHSLAIGGGVVLTIGAGLIGGAAIRWGILARAQRRASR